MDDDEVDHVSRMHGFAQSLPGTLKIGDIGAIAHIGGMPVALDTDAMVATLRGEAEKLSALRTEDYFRGRAVRGDLEKAFAILARAGVGNPPTEDDDLLSDPATEAAR